MKEKDPRQDALFEIGTEEIPAFYFAPAFAFMKSFTENFLKERNLAFEAVECLGTPRRMAILITALPPKSESQTEQVWGPPVRAAKDAAGAWTQAAKGFAQAQGVPVDQLQILPRPEKGGEYLCAVKKHAGVKTEKILIELFNALLPAIPFPKKMVWNETRFRFPRPIRNLVALYGHQALRVSVAGVKSTNKTYGLSHLVPPKIKISSAQAYVTTLKNHCVLVNPEARKQAILHAAEQLAHKTGGKLKQDDKLLEEVSWLVEHPVCVMGGFEQEFLEVPQEVLMTCMKKHQKFFSIVDSKGKIMPHFIAVRNGISEHQDIVRKGYEKVLKARLTDARFFFHEDLKRPLEKFVEKCGEIQLQEKLGSMRDKTRRMQSIARFTIDTLQRLHAEAGEANGQIDPAQVERAIHLSKFDLTTSMVFEFPELQGTIGEVYAAKHGENPRVSRAIREHYYPLSAQGELPGDPLSGVVAFADKLESLAGNFLVGHQPSGNSDPYGLRRQSTGLIRILLQNEWAFALKEFIAHAFRQFQSNDVPQQPAGQLAAFLMERFQLLMQDSNFAIDEINAVTRNAHADAQELKLIRLRDKIAAVHEARKHGDFEAVGAAFKRASNILKQARGKGLSPEPGAFKPELLQEDPEKDLYSQMSQLRERIAPLLAQRKYRETLLQLVTLRAALDRFFDKVMVMAPDPALSGNRLALLALFESFFKEIADLSHLQG